MSNFKNPPISFHPTLSDTLQVNWKQEYNSEFICPQCNQGRLNNYFYTKTVTCKIRLRCDTCKKSTSLSCSLVKNSPISFHSTLNEPLRVNWKQEYHKEFICPKCNRAKIENFMSHKKSNYKLRIRCNSCNQTTSLSCLIIVYGHCTLDPKIPCPVNLFPKCYGCSSFRPSTGKLPLYERQYQGEQQRLTEAETAGVELAQEEAKATIEAMDKWLPELRRLANA